MICIGKTKCTSEKGLLRWSETVSSTFQDLQFDGGGGGGHYNHSLSVNATVMVPTNCPIIGEEVSVNFVAQ